MPAVRGQGQWGLGYREPLNANEQAKKDSDPLTVKQRIVDVYAKTGFDGIDGTDLRSRFRWFGLYTQRAEGIPGGKTAVLEPHELEAPYFMLRIRVDGGQLTNEQLRVIGEVSTEYGRDVADITDRQNVQLHWIRVEDVPAIWSLLCAGLADDVAALGLFPSAEAAVGAVVELTPFGRLGTVEDMADAVVFLASDAARFVTGTGLAVDGGMGM